MKQTKRICISQDIPVTFDTVKEIKFEIDLSYTPAKIFGKYDDLHGASYNAEIVHAWHQGVDVIDLLSNKQMQKVINDAWHEFDYE